MSHDGVTAVSQETIFTARILGFYDNSNSENAARDDWFLVQVKCAGVFGGKQLYSSEMVKDPDKIWVRKTLLVGEKEFYIRVRRW